VFVTEKSKDAGPAAKLLSPQENQALAQLLSSGVSRGKEREVQFGLLEGHANKIRRLIAVGLGDPSKITLQTLREAAAALARAAHKMRLPSLEIALPQINAVSPADTAEAVVDGFLLGNFDYAEYKGTISREKQEKSENAPVSLGLAAGADLSAAQRGAARGRILADAQNFARTVASRPGNDVNPPVLAKTAQQLARSCGLSCRILDEKELARQGMGGILAVGGGSATPPRLIVLEHRPKSRKNAARLSSTLRLRPEGSSLKSAPLLVVGKGITFDAGGISIKPADRMGLMIYDKCGAMAVLGLMYAAAKLQLDIPIVGVLSAAENTLGSRAYRPGDIIRMYSGATVEVTNTDAEGRLVLADALAWGIAKYRPAAAVDLATLTGGVIIALGVTMAGVMSNNDDLVAEFTVASQKSGEKFWRLPLGDDQRDQLKSTHADILNSAGREGAPLTGAAFVSHFVPRDGSVPWAHFDIAGVADTEKELPCYAKGATGWGVRTLVEWAASRAKQ
jgi:leucyl aminopeptidase